MAKQKKYQGGKYNWRGYFEYGITHDGHLTAEVLSDWYEKCQPGGSAPNGLLRMLCAAIEEAAQLRGIDLKKTAEYLATIKVLEEKVCQ